MSIDTSNGDLGATVVEENGSYNVSVPADVATSVVLSLQADGVAASSKTIDVTRPLSKVEANVSAGFERFFSLSDFGYSDIESTPISSVSIQIPDADVGTLMLGSGGFDTENSVSLTDRAVVPSDFNSIKVVDINPDNNSSIILLSKLSLIASCEIPL